MIVQRYRPQNTNYTGCNGDLAYSILVYHPLAVTPVAAGAAYIDA
jgi:hypothetical protein